MFGLSNWMMVLTFTDMHKTLGRTGFQGKGTGRKEELCSGHVKPERTVRQARKVPRRRPATKAWGSEESSGTEK